MKKNTAIYAIIILVVCVIVGIATYAMMNKPEKIEDKKTNDDGEPIISKDGVNFTKVESSDEKIVTEFEVILNGKAKSFNIEYTVETIEGGGYIERGFFSGNEIYSSDTESKDLDENRIKSTIDESNFKIIKGEDNKNYLLVRTHYKEGGSFDTSELLVFNDELENISVGLIKEDESPDHTSHDGFIVNNFMGNIPCKFEGENSPLYPRTYQKVNESTDGDRQYTKVLDNKIYFLFPKITSDYKNSTLEERVYTINANKLEFKVERTYKILEVCQQI